MLCHLKVVSKVLSRGHGMSKSPGTKDLNAGGEMRGRDVFT